MNPVLRQTKYNSLRSGRVCDVWAEGSQTPGAVQKSRCIWSEQAELLRSSSRLFIHTYYLGQTNELVHADLIEVHQRTTVNHDQLHNVTAYSNHIKYLATLVRFRNESTIESLVSVYAEAIVTWSIGASMACLSDNSPTTTIISWAYNMGYVDDRRLSNTTWVQACHCTPGWMEADGEA